MKIKIESNNSDDIARQLFNQIKDSDIVCEVITSLSTMLSNEDKIWCINGINKFLPTDKRMIHPIYGDRS